jgi:hypothetical protein
VLVNDDVVNVPELDDWIVDPQPEPHMVAAVDEEAVEYQA